MIHSDPQVGLQKFMVSLGAFFPFFRALNTNQTLLCSYENMFTMPCEKCQRVLCAEGHVAAVERVWNESKGYWEARHVSC